MDPEIIVPESADYTLLLEDVNLRLNNLQEQNKELIFWFQAQSFATIMIFIAIVFSILSNNLKGAGKR